MNLLVLGTGPFVIPTFEAILADGHQVPMVVTRPAVIHKGIAAAPNPMRVAAESHGIPVFAPDSINAPDVIDDLRNLAVDLMVVCDYGQILSADALQIARMGGINLHGSLLPKYRGAAPVQWCVYHGDEVSGVSVIHLTPRLDGGPILTQRSLDVQPDETAGNLEGRLALLGVEAVREALELLATWDGQTPLGRPQDPDLVSRAPRLQKSQGQIDWTRSARQIRNQIRAFQPWPGSFTSWTRSPKPSLRLIVGAAEVIDSAGMAASGDSVESTPGTVIRSEKNALWLQTGDGVLALTRVQPSGKRVMEIDEFQRGYAVPVGQAFQ